MTKPDPDNTADFEVCVVPTVPEKLARLKRAILRRLQRSRYGPEATFAVKLALEEALSNAVKHGNRNDRSKSITIRYSVDPERTVIIIRDEGEGFEPECVPDCRLPERLPVPNGRGIMLIRAYMDVVEFRDRGREIYCVKYRK